MAYCSECGHKLDSEAKFCSGCGKPVNGGDDGSQRKHVFEGSIHKCPNCGEAIDSFVSKCPSCGHEFRDSKSSSALNEFTKKLEEIESTRKQSSKLGDFANALGVGSNKTNDQKENLVRNFAVPNNKEDIFEFMILAASNIDSSLFCIYGNTGMMAGERNSQLKVTKAWVAKFEQAYQKARLTFGSDQDFKNIENIYLIKTKEIKISKLKGPLTFVGLMTLLVALFIFMGSLIK